MRWFWRKFWRAKWWLQDHVWSPFVAWVER